MVNEESLMIALAVSVMELPMFSSVQAKNAVMAQMAATISKSFLIALQRFIEDGVDVDVVVLALIGEEGFFRFLDELHHLRI